MPPIEMWRRSERDEELAAVRIRPSVGHREHPGDIVSQIRMELIFKLIPGTAVTLAERIPALQHEAPNDPMKDDAIVEGLLVPLPRLRVFPFLRAFGETSEI